MSVEGTKASRHEGTKGEGAVAGAVGAPWHRESYLRFINEYLPALLDERLPLGHYAAREADGGWELTVGLTRAAGAVQASFGIPGCDADGVFHTNGTPRVVVPVATAARLDEGEILCVGEQLLRILEAQIAPAPAGLTWDAELLSRWLGLDAKITAFLNGKANRDTQAMLGWGTVQALDMRNPLAKLVHLRRLVVPCRNPASGSPSDIVHPSEMNRTCPFETPEGPQVARVLSIARGATIRDRKLVIVGTSHAGKLGVNVATIPCFNHTDANRLLMGANMQRQWVELPNPEPALVQTGLEPAVPGFWCGRNLLTAYLSLGANSFEDAIVISASAARRLSPSPDAPLEVGDKLSNRHGQKGVISAILPDAQMPHTPDGRAVDLVFSFLGLQSRMSFGQLREGLLGLVAEAEGQTVLVPPFEGPTDDELQQRLRAKGLPEDGMQQLRDGAGGRPFARLSFAGNVYWGLTFHRSRPKLSLEPQTASHVLYLALREIRAADTIRDLYHRQSAGQPVLGQLERALSDAGIVMRVGSGQAEVFLREATAEDLRLATPMPLPWLPEQQIEWVGHAPEELREANAALEQLLSANAPARLLERAKTTLQRTLNEHFTSLLPSELLRLEGRPLHSGRAVIAPSNTDAMNQSQCGLPEALAWKLFGSMVAREVGEEAAAARTAEATTALDRAMASQYVLLVREPAVIPSAVIAFHPVRCTGNVIRLHPLCCAMMNADHDGDEVAVYLPVTPAGQAEAAAKLTCAGHLRRDPAAIRWMVPRLDPLFGLAWLSRTETGRQQIAAIAGSDCTAGQPFVSLTSLRDAMAAYLREHGPERTLEVMHELMLLGFAAIRASGCSFNPFAHRAMPAVPPTGSVTPAHPQPSTEASVDQVISRNDYDAHPFGPQLFAIKSGARGNTMQLAFGLMCRTIIDYDRTLHYFAGGALGGLSPEACFMSYIGARLGIAQCNTNVASSMRQAYGVTEPAVPQGFGAIARAMRSADPGQVFARAALMREVDPLADLDSRLLVGL